jgi:hypothetical protein
MSLVLQVPLAVCRKVAPIAVKWVATGLSFLVTVKMAANEKAKSYDQIQLND